MSTSTWIFWLFTSLLVGFIQLLYSSYQFLMIGWDIGMLSLLKTFALMRSYIRYYTIKSGFSKKQHDPNHKYNKRGRRREWREKINGATNYKEFLKIAIQSPVPVYTKNSTMKISMTTLLMISRIKGMHP